MQSFQSDPKIRRSLKILEQKVAAGGTSAFRAARRLLGDKYPARASH
jgi:hypothetical protein